jgi:hypothetical protein
VFGCSSLAEAFEGGAGESVASSAPPPDFALFLSSHSVFEKMNYSTFCSFTLESMIGTYLSLIY